ncbi:MULTISPECIES: hypothetical protein [unclassified Bosea (in: a-proteobacteria)]|nr:MULTISPECIES: hypothetical protein [unclassified Bosea (in: a-proteobacteria)]
MELPLLENPLTHHATFALAANDHTRDRVLEATLAAQEAISREP